LGLSHTSLHAPARPTSEQASRSAPDTPASQAVKERSLAAFTTASVQAAMMSKPLMLSVVAPMVRLLRAGSAAAASACAFSRSCIASFRLALILSASPFLKGS
jgi:hypothetical protein